MLLKSVVWHMRLLYEVLRGWLARKDKLERGDW